MGKIHIYNTLDKNRKTIDGNGRLCDLLPDFNFTNAVILKGGYRVTEEYEVKEDDILFVRSTPSGLTTLAAVAITSAVVAVGGVIGSTLYTKGKIQEAQKQLDQAQQKAKALSEAIQQQPFVQGAKNKNALGQVIPIIMGEVFHAPYLILSRRYHISGTDGTDQYVDGVMCLGYNNQIVKSFSIGKTKIKSWSDTTPQNGVYKQDSGIYYDANNIIEIRQAGNFDTDSFNQKVTVTDSGSEIKHDHGGKVEPLIIQAAENAESIEVAISFQGLRRYTDEGNWTNASVKVVPYWSNNADSTRPTWTPFTFSGSSDNTFSRNTNKEIRFVAKKTFTAQESYGKKITIKLERQTPKAESNANDTVTCLYVQTLHYDAKKSTAQSLVKCDPMENPYRDMTTRVGVRLKATPSTQNLLDEFNFIVQGTARTWNGTSWSTGKSATRNPASWLLELLTYPHHRHSRYSDEELDLESFGQLYEYCEAENFHTDGIVTATKKKSDLLSSILSACFSDIIIGAEGKLEAVTDKKEDTPIALLNSQSIISATVSKAFSRKTDGRKVTFTNRKVWQIDNAYIMKNGGSKTQDDVVTELAPEYVTEHDHAYKIAKRDMAREELQPREITVEVGREGEYYPLYAVVNVQLQQLRVGLQSAIIHSTKQSGGYMSEIVISDYVDIVDGYTYGVTIQAQDDTGRKTITAEVTGTGRTRTLTVLTPVAVEGVMPVYGNILSFGIIDKVTIPMKITGVKPGKNGFNLTLRDYNPAMYEYGEIPEYKTNLTTPPQAGEKVPTLTEAQISDIATGAAGGVVQKGETPDTPAIIATAEKEGIRLQVLPLSATAKNVIQYATWEINKGTDWESVEDTDLQAFYAFDRKADGYPEVSDLSSWRVRCQVVNLWGKASAYGGTEAGQVINTDNYGTWELQPPVVVVSTSNRSVNLKLAQADRSDNRVLYGTIRHRIQIKRPDIDSQFYKPAEGLNPLESEQNYKDGSGHVTATISYTQTLPLQGQNDDPPAPTATLYQYQVTAENEAGLSSPTVVNATALATSVYDIVKGWYKNEQGEKVKIPGALGAESIYTESLAAISANMGDITAGKISSVPEAGETKPNVSLDLDKEEFRIGNNPSLEDSGSDDAEYIHYTKGHGLVMKIKNFIVTAVASIVSGVFRVKGKGTADASSFFVVNPESTTDSTTHTPGKTVKINGGQMFPYNYGVRYYKVPDMTGHPRHILISDISEFWTSPETTAALPKQGFCGFLTFCRTASLNIDGGAFVECVVSYKNKNTSTDKEVVQLRYNPTIVKNYQTGKPCVVKYNDRYYLSLYHKGSTTFFQLCGAMFELLPEFQTVFESDLEVIQEGIIETITDNLTVTGDATVGGLINSTRIRSDFDMGAVSINNGAGHLLTGYNIDIGADALKSVQSGAYENIALGRYAGYGITTGDSNIAIGFNSGRNITTGNKNIAIGADVPLPDLDKQIAIGNIRQVRFSATTTGATVWKYFQLICPGIGFSSCVASSKSFHGYKLRKENNKQLITLYNTGDIVAKTIGNNKTTLGEELIILCNYEYFS